jgi:predicted nucleic acid-binding protein
MNFADTNWLEAMFVHIDEERPRRVMVERFHRQYPDMVGVSHIVLLEARNVFSRITGQPNPPEWQELQAGFSGRFYLDPMNWDLLRREIYRIFEKYSHVAQIGTLDAAVLASAILAGATRLLSFDERLKALAVAEELEVFPKLAGEGRAYLVRLKTSRH